MDIKKALERLNVIHTFVKIAEEYDAKISLPILKHEIEIIQRCLMDESN
jgi:hypothetical protein